MTKKPTQSLGDVRSEHVSHRPTLVFVGVPYMVPVACSGGVQRGKGDLV